MVAERFLFNLVNFNESDQLEFVEFCAGRAHLSREMLRQGFHQGASVEILFHPHHDMLSSKGLRTWFDMVVASRRKSLHWFATRCSSFVPLCISQSMNSFYGDRSRPWVEQGNLQQEVTAMMMFFSFLLDCIPVLEQPTGSVLPKLPSLRNVLWFFDFKKTVTYMGSFAGPTSKPLQIWHPSSGPGSLFTAIARPRPDGLDNLASSGQSWDGSHTYTGNKEMLIESEHYTPEFGACRPNLRADSSFVKTSQRSICSALSIQKCLECDKSTIAQGFFCADSPEWCVPLSTLTVSVGSRGNMAFAPAKKCAISDRALQVQRLPSHVLQSISSIESLALWLFEILQICVLRLELFCSATKLAPLPRVQCRHA